MGESIRIEQVAFTYPTGVRALRGVSASISPGEAVAIVGENGAGKTTLARHLNGLLHPTSGHVLIGDWDTSKHTVAQLATRVSYSFQNPDDQIFERTVRAEVTFGPRNLGFSADEMESAVQDALSQVGLLSEIDHHPYDLQLSQRKLLTLAATLAMRTPIVILDEPTTGQDAPGVRRIAEIVEHLKAASHTLITITHDLDFAAEHFERVIVMAGGLIIADGPAHDVLAQESTLAAALVDPPQMVRLALALGFDSIPLTPEEFVLALKNKSGRSS